MFKKISSFGCAVVLFVMLTVCIFPVGNVVNADAAVVQSRYSAEIQPFGGTFVNTQYRTINYTYKTDTDKYVNPWALPQFKSGLSSACSIDAGGAAMVYFDRPYDGLIPNYSHRYTFGVFSYNTQNAGVNTMYSSLYSLMGTNSGGTTIPGFKSGMTQYASGKGRTMQITQATGSYYNTNINFIKAQLELEKLAVIFLDEYSITSFGGIQENSGYDYVTNNIYSGMHTMTIYGYRDICYYDASYNLIERDTYFYAYTGMSGILGWINITEYCTIDDAYIINVV